MADSISDTAKYLAACVASLDSHARDRFTSDDDLYEKAVRFAVEGYLQAFQSSIQRVVPVLGELTRDTPVRYAGCAGASFHAVTCEIALRQYNVLWMLTDTVTYFASNRATFEGIEGTEVSADSVVADWPRAAEWLAGLFMDCEAIDAMFLCSGIDTDPRPQAVLSGIMPIVEFAGDGTAKIQFRGETFANVDFEAAKMLQELIDHYPTPHGLTTDDRPQPGRIIAKLPEELRNIIQTEGKKGRVLAI